MMKPSMKTKLKRYFEDEGISRADISEKTGFAVDYLRNMFAKGSDPLTGNAKYMIMAAYPQTIAILLPQPPTEQEERR